MTILPIPADRSVIFVPALGCTLHSSQAASYRRGGHAVFLLVGHRLRPSWRTSKPVWRYLAPIPRQPSWAMRFAAEYLPNVMGIDPGSPGGDEVVYLAYGPGGRLGIGSTMDEARRRARCEDPAPTFGDHWNQRAYDDFAASWLR